MKKYFGYQDAINDLNARGFTNDFVLFGNDLLWVQGKIFIRGNDFSVVEYHQIGHPDGKIEDLKVFGILAVSANIKGVLLNHYSYTSAIPAVLINKLTKMRIQLQPL